MSSPALKSTEETRPDVAALPRSPAKHYGMPTEGHDDGEGNWLVSYADLMTLLVGFFAMMMSLSKIDSAQYERLKKEATKEFGGKYEQPFEKLAQKLREVAEEANLASKIHFEENEEGVIATFQDALFFESGSAALLPAATSVLDRLIPVISKYAKDFRIVVEGHTDDRPIHSAVFASNWELSSVRACSVVRLFHLAGFPNAQLRPVGLADTEPVAERGAADVSASDSRARDRRVVIKILRN